MFKIEDYLTPEELQKNADVLNYSEPIQQPQQGVDDFITSRLTQDEQRANGFISSQQSIQQPNTPPTVAQGLQNVWNDVSTAATNVVQNAPQIWNDIVESGKQNLTTEGIKQTIPALAEGIGYGAVDALPNIAGLGVDLANSYHGYEAIKKPELLNSPFRRWYEAGKEGREGAWDTDKAGFTQGLGMFLAPGAVIGKAGNAAKLAKASKASAVQQANALEKAERVAGKLDDVQKAKYARQIEKLKEQYQTPQEILAQAEKNKTLGKRVLDETTFGAVTGLTEGENLEERIQNALVGGAMGAGGTLGHAGISKGLKTKPVASALTSAKDKINNVIDNHELLAKGAGFVDNAMNLNTAQGKAKKYSELYKRASDASRFERTANLKEKEMLELAEQMSPEEYKKAVDYLKNGDEKTAKRVLKERLEQNKGNKSKESVKKDLDDLFAMFGEEQVVEEIISPYGDGKPMNERLGSYEQLKSLGNKQRLDEKQVKRLPNAEEEIDLLIDEINNTTDVERKNALKKQLEQKIKTNKEKSVDRITDEEFSVKTDDEFKKEFLEEQRQYLDDEYNAKDTDGETRFKDEPQLDEVKKDYIGGGFHEEGIIQEKARYGKDVINDTMSKAERDRGLNFIDFYEQYKGASNKQSRDRLYKRYMRTLDDKNKLWASKMIEEQTTRDVEQARIKSNKDAFDKDLIERQKRAKEVQDETASINNKEVKLEKEYTPEENAIADNTLREQAKGLLFKRHSEASKGQKKTSFKVSEERKMLSKFLDQRGYESVLDTEFTRTKNPQELYDDLFKTLSSSKNKAINASIKKLNDIARPYAKTKSVFAETNNATKYNNVIDSLQEAVKNKNINAISKIFAEHNNQLHKKYGLTSRQRDVIADGYYLKAQDFIDNVKKFENEGGKIDKDTLRALRKRYDQLKNIIKNSFTDWEQREMRSFNREGVLEGTGDVWNRQQSGIKQQPFEKVMRDIEAILYPEGKERTIKYQQQRYEQKVDSNTSKRVFESVNDVIRGDKTLSRAVNNVAPGYHLDFLDGVAKKTGSASKVMSAIDEFIKNGNHKGEKLVNESLRKYISDNNGEIKTVFKPEQVFVEVIDLDNPVSKKLKQMLSFYKDKNNIFAIANDDFGGIGNQGGTITSGFSYVKMLKKDGKYSQGQLIGTTAHELLHNFVRHFPEEAESLFGITKEDVANAYKVNKELREFLNSEEGKIWNKFKNADETTLTDEQLEILHRGNKLEEAYINSKEEFQANKLKFQVVELAKDVYNKKHNKMKGVKDGQQENVAGRNRQTLEGNDGRRGDSDSSTGSRGSEGEGQKNRTGNEKKKSSLTGEYLDENGNVADNLKVVEEIDTSFKDFTDQVFNNKKNLEKLGISDKIKTYTDYITTVSKATEELLLKHKTMTPEMIKAALKKFGSEDGVYFKQFFGDSADMYVQEKTGLLGTKKTQGKGTHGNAKLTAIANAQRMINFQHAETVVEYLKQNFGEKVARGKSHPDNYVAVNSDILWNALAFKKSNKWIETLSAGKTAMKEAFSEADYNEFKGLVDRAGKADIYLPKEALNAILDGSGESIAQYFNNYIKGRKVDSKYIAKLSGAFLDFTNNQFKKAVLSTGSFFTNNRIGNQIMLAAKSGNLKDYVEGTYNALKAKDNVPSEIMTSLLLEACENFGGKRRYTGWESVDNLLNLMDGHFISTKGQTGLKKASTFAANACIGMPNKIYNFLVDKVMRLNEKFERFERKQAYFQEIAKAKREGILKTGSKALTVEELLKHIDENPNLKEYVVDNVNDVLGDYNNFSNAEKKVFKRIIPFYSWHRTIFRHTIKLAKENPTRFGLIAWKLYMINNREDGRPDWQRGAIDSILGLWKPDKGYVINKKGVIPYATIGQDLTKVKGLIPGLSKDAGENIMGDINPALKTGYEALIGKKTFAPASEITHKDWKRVTRDKKEGYFNKKTGEFVEGTPWQVRAGYVGKGLLKTVYPYLENPSLKGTTSFKEISEKGKLPDKMYDASAGGYFNKEYIGTFNGKKKYRSAKMELPLKYQIANRVLGLGIQKDLKSEEKMKKAQERYSNKRKKK